MNGDGDMTQVKAFVTEHIESVVQLEVLLLLHRDPSQTWTAAEVAEELRVASVWVAVQMADLSSRGLLKREDGPPARYVYSPRSADLQDSIDRVARAYTERRVSVINMIYAKPIDKLRSFSEAFRFRKGEPDG